jgi:xanthine dehydrogenase/oxidase
MDTKLAAGGALAAAAAAFACFGGVQPESKGLRAGPSGSIVVFVNGVQVVVAPHELHPRMTLLEFLRENRKLSGAKLSCAQGGCGACTVMLTSWDKSCGEWQHRAVNACLRPVLACDGMAILTTEGIGNKQDGFHPVQERIAKCNGSQCGFCTPGQVMSLYSLLRESGGEPLTLDAIEERFDGNICRCTGYRPIMTAAHTFAAEGPLGDKTDITNFAPKFASYDPASEKPPPEGLKQQAAATLSVTSTDGSAAWFRVGSLSELDAVRASTRGQKSTLVVGNTMTGECPPPPGQQPSDYPGPPI